MARFETALRLDLEHAYFNDNRCRGLRLTSDSATSRLFQRPELALRVDDHGLSVIVDREAPAIDAVFEDAAVDLHFEARLAAADWVYTSNLALRETAIPPVLTAAAAVAEQARLRLHAGTVVALEDFSDDDAKAGSDLRCSTALFCLTVPLRHDDPGPAHYVVQFGARLTHWRYNFVGDFESDELRIIDLDADQTFGPQTPSTLANGRSAISIRSNNRLALKERSDHRFQLLAREGSGERIVVGRLPVAGVGRLADNGTISDIYVHSGP